MARTRSQNVLEKALALILVAFLIRFWHKNPAEVVLFVAFSKLTCCSGIHKGILMSRSIVRAWSRQESAVKKRIIFESIILRNETVSETFA